jgi:hypothetical protein
MNDSDPLAHDLNLIKTAILYGDKVNLYSHHYSFHKSILTMQDNNASIEDMMHSAFTMTNIHCQVVTPSDSHRKITSGTLPDTGLFAARSRRNKSVRREI